MAETEESKLCIRCKQKEYVYSCTNCHPFIKFCNTVFLISSLSFNVSLAFYKYSDLNLIYLSIIDLNLFANGYQIGTLRGVDEPVPVRWASQTLDRFARQAIAIHSTHSHSLCMLKH